MRRIGFRRALPLAFTLIHFMLVWFSLVHLRHAASVAFRESKYRTVAYQESVGDVPIETFGERPPLKPVQKIALILELPAMFLALVIAGLLFPPDEMAWLYTSVVFVPSLWFAIGRWLDGLMGYVPRLRLPKILRGACVIPAYGLLCISIGGLTPLYHHRTLDSYWVFTGIALWSGLCVAIMLSTSKGTD